SRPRPASLTRRPSTATETRGLVFVPWPKTRNLSAMALRLGPSSLHHNSSSPLTPRKDFFSPAAVHGPLPHFCSFPYTPSFVFSSADARARIVHSGLTDESLRVRSPGQLHEFFPGLAGLHQFCETFEIGLAVCKETL